MTKRNEHTPGPWKHDASYNVPVGLGDIPEHQPSCWISRPEGGLEIRFGCHETRESILAAMRLIAAAPVLLAAAHDAEKTFNVSTPIEPIVAFAVVERLRSAIAQARGES